MDEDYHILYVDEADESVWRAIGGGIRNYNIQQAGDHKHQSVCFVLNSPDQEIVGGVIGETYWDWFYINLLWVKLENVLMQFMPPPGPRKEYSDARTL
jgi:hypothetical protein